MKIISLWGCCLFLLFMAPSWGQGRFAELVLLDAKVWTVNPRNPQAEAVAVAAGRIAAVGSTKEIEPWVGPQTTVLRLGQRRVLPGFNDSHTHFLSGGFHLLGVDLRAAMTEAEFIKRIAEKAASLNEGEWITGGDWDHQQWPSRQLPRRDWIDKVTPKNPILVNRHDGHMALANTLALKRARIDATTPDPSGGLIVRDARTGEPTGLLKDAAMSLVLRFVPAPTEEQNDRAILRALQEAARVGVTSLQDMGGFENVRSYQRLLKRNALTARIYAAIPLPQWERLAQAAIVSGFGNEWLRMGAVKGFMDGSLGSSTALMFEAFADEPGNRGLPSDMALPEGNMKKLVTAATRAGLHVLIHGIGDRANNELLNIFEGVTQELGPAERRFRIEHAQHLLPSDIARFARLAVIPSMQPYHAIDDGRWAEKRLGPERSRSTYAFRSLLDAHALLTFGSDWTVAPLDPLLGIYAAVTRRTTDGKNPGGWIPQEKISVQEAIQCYTLNSAYSTFEERLKGSIEEGKYGDLVVLSEDILNIAPERIGQIMVDYTIAGGRIVFSRLAPAPNR